MNMLEYLAQKRNDMSTPSHPLAQNSANFKYIYCFGLAVLVYGYKDQLPATLDCFSSILNSLHLDSEQQKKLPLQVKNHFDLKITEVFRTVATKQEQYCFIADLYRLSFFGLISPTYCHDIIEGYCQVFNLTDTETSFLKEFTNLGYQTTDELNKQTISYYDTKLDSAVLLYENFKLSGYDIPTPVLEYIFPSFSLTNEIEDLSLDDGSIKRFESNLKIHGNLVISNCSTIVLDHAKVKIDGKISIKNGKIIIRNSELFVEQCNAPYLLSIEDTPNIRIEHSTIDCNNQTSFLQQNNGQLKLRNSYIKNTIQKPAIDFSGNSADISKSSFDNCKSGAFLNTSKKELFIGSCSFSNCHNMHGGAIHSHSLANTTIYNCNFQDCHAKYLGGAIYFANLKYGQSVIQCKFENCTPTDSTLFNVYTNPNPMYIPK